jgi:hypothetical protein
MMSPDIACLTAWEQCPWPGDASGCTAIAALTCKAARCAFRQPMQPQRLQARGALLLAARSFGGTSQKGRAVLQVPTSGSSRNLLTKPSASYLSYLQQRV